MITKIYIFHTHMHSCTNMLGGYNWNRNFKEANPESKEIHARIMESKSYIEDIQKLKSQAKSCYLSHAPKCPMHRNVVM